MPRELAQRRPTCIYRHPIENIPVGPFSGLSAHAPDVLQGALEASDRLLAAMCPSRLKLSIGAQRLTRARSLTIDRTLLFN